MEETPYREKYIFDGRGVLALLGGMLAGTTAVAILNVIVMYVFKVNLQYDDVFLILSNAGLFLGAIFAFDYFI